MAGPIINIADVQVPVGKTPMDRNFFNTRYLAFVSAINSLALRQDGFDAAENNLVSVGLQHINDTLGPFLSNLQEAATLGFLIAGATGPIVSLAQGVNVQFTLNSPGFNIFTPTPWLLAMDATDQTNWGILGLTSYNSANGVLACTCVYASKTKNSSQWNISCDSASFPAMLNILSQVTTMYNTIASDYTAIQADMVTINNAITSIAAGPVVSVAGRTGVVSLGEGDITNLVSDLAAKASVSAMNSGLAGKQNTSAIMTALSNLVLTANQLIYATSATSLAAQTISAFMLGLMNSVDAPTLRSSIGTAYAATSDFYQSSSATVLSPDSVFNAAAYVALTDAPTIAVNLSTGFNFSIALTASRQLGFPTDSAVGLAQKVGQSGFIDVVQPSGGGLSLSFAPGYTFPNGAAPTIAQGSGNITSLYYHVRSPSEVRIAVAFNAVH